MKKLTLLLLLSSCQWVITHPKEDAELLKIGEEIAADIYKYEFEQPQELPVNQ